MSNRFFEQALSTNFKNIEYDFYETNDVGHGRVEQRRCWSLGQVEWLIDAEKWAQFTSIARIESVRDCEGKISREGARRHQAH